MNGTTAPDQRVARKRELEVELEAIRGQKAEVLRQIQQIAKKQRLSGPPSKNLALTYDAKVEAERRNHAEQVRRIWSLCTRILQEILKNSHVKLYFGEPVHRDKFPQYYDIITQPRDLGTIKSNIDRGMYRSVDEFVADVRLCFENCRTFNQLGPVRKIGDGASDQFEKKWATRRIDEEWRAEMQRHHLAMARLEAESKSLPDKMREVDTELQELAVKAAARAAPPPPGPGRDMTFEEKRKLSHMLGSVPGERLARVLEIVAAGPSAALLQGEDEFELDVDALDNGTLWKLQAYVDSVTAEIDHKATKPGAGVTVPDAAAAAPAGGAAAAVPAVGGGAVEGGAEAPAPPAVEEAAPATTAPDDGAGSEEVGSKGNADSTGLGEESKKVPPAAGGARGHDMTTFVSATGPGAQPQILRNSTQKKDVQLQNAGAWANLQAAPAAGPTAPAAGAAAGGDGGAADAGDGAVPMEDDDTLWTEFQGRESQQAAAEQQKKALEEAQKEREAAAEEAARRAATEAAEAEAKRKVEQAEAAKRAEEELRAREAAELRQMNTQGAEDAEVDAMRQADHGANPVDVGLVAREVEEENLEDEVMDI